MRKAFAYGLNLIAPGLGFAFTGRFGLLVLFVLAYFLPIIFICWTRYIFTPSVLYSLFYYLVSLHVIACASTAFTQPYSKIRHSGLATLFSLLGWTFCWCAFIVFRESVFGWAIYHIPSGSMKPTLEPGNLILVDTWYYHHEQPKPGDVIVFTRSPTDSAVFVKRVHPLPKAFASHPNGIYVLGDNRDFSTDSRQFGLIDTKNVIGQVKMLILDRKGWVGRRL